MGDALGNIAIAKAQQAASIMRGNDYSAAATQLNQGLDAINKTQNMGLPSTVQNFGDSVDATIQQTLANHGGGPASTVMLQNQLSQLKTGLMARAQSMSDQSNTIQAQTQFQQVLGPASSLVYNDPTQLSGAMAQVTAKVNDQVGMRTPPEAEAILQGAKQTLITNAVLGALHQGGTQGIFQAQNIVTDAAKAGFLDADTLVNLNGQIHAANQFMAGKAFEYNQRPSNFVPDNASAYIHGTLDPVDSRRMELEVQQLALPRTVMDPQSGLPMTVPGVDPGSDMRAALAAHGIILPSTAAAAGSPAVGIPQAPVAGAPGAPLGPATTVGAPVTARNAGPLPGTVLTPGDPGYQPNASPAGAAPVPVPAQGQPGAGATQNETLYSYAKNGQATGAGAEASRLFYNYAPVVGGALGSPAASNAETEVNAVKNNLASIFTNANIAGGNRPPPKETEEIASLLDELDPKMLGNQTAYVTTLAKLDDVLGQMHDEYLDRADPHGAGAPMGTDVRQQAAQIANQITHIRQQLGVPPRLTPQQSWAMPAGSEFRKNSGPENGQISISHGKPGGQ